MLRPPRPAPRRPQGASPGPYSAAGESPSTTGAGTPTASLASPPVTPPAPGGSMVQFAQGLMRPDLWRAAGAPGPGGAESVSSDDRRGTGDGSEGDVASAREIVGTSLGDALLKLAEEYDRRARGLPLCLYM